MSFTPIGGETMLNGNGPLASYDVAVAGNGVAYVAAVNTVRSPSLGRDVGVLSVQKYDQRGRPLGAPAVISRYVHLNAPVAVDANAAGQAVIAYVEGRGSSEVLIVRRLDTLGSGGAEDPGTRLFTLPAKTGFERFRSSFGGVAVSMADNGGYFVAHRDADPRDILVQYRSPTNSTTVINALDNVTASYDELENFDLSARPDGSGAVFAAGVNDAGGGQTLYGSVSTTAKVGNARRIASTRTDTAQPAVAVTGNNAFVIAYQDAAREDSGGTLVTQRYDVAGNAVGARITQDTRPDGVDFLDAGTPTVAATADGGFVVAYLQGAFFDKNDPKRDVSTLLTQRYAPDGTSDDSGAVTLDNAAAAETGERFGSPVIDVDAYGNASVLYGRSPDRAEPSDLVLRRLTSGILVDRREVYVVGTGGDDVIRVEEAAGVNGRVRVSVNGQSRRLPATHVAAVTAVGLGGDDRIDVLRAVPATLRGGAGRDTLLGSAGTDLIRGDSGDDRLYGNDGDDTLDGGEGNDFLRGGLGDDALTGSAGRDTLYGDAGRDALNGGPGFDRLFGGPDTDTGRSSGEDILDAIETIVRR
ncbi:MAG TPA: hypothetical protein VF595_14470 [Tepidisphaeraceae bacterium]|jgi:Ca2+-binding RTX toxin-like protein